MFYLHATVGSVLHLPMIGSGGRGRVQLSEAQLQSKLRHYEARAQTRMDLFFVSLVGSSKFEQ